MAFNGGVVVYFSLLKGINKIKWLTNIMSTLTLLSILITVLLVYKYGIIGSGIRTILFSWIGTVICITVGKKVFNTSYNYKSILEFSVLLPIAGLLVYFIGVYSLNYYTIDTWSSVILSYLLFAILTLFSLFVLNFLIFPRTGSCSYLLNFLKLKLFKK